MVLESTMICVDDSNYMRNGDFVPTRMAAVQDAVNIVCLTKTRANPENNVGLLTLASSEVLTTLTTDCGKIMSKMLACQPNGELKLMSGLRVAHLALKHRQGKNHRMRIIVFIGSPIEVDDESEWTRLAKKMKKEKVNVDIVAFGDGNSDLLQVFIDTLNGREGTGSHLIVIPPGPTIADALKSSPLLQSEDGAPIAPGGFDFGIDPNDDPELALALRVSMDEQRNRQNTLVPSGPPDSTGATISSEAEMLQRALAISREPEAAQVRVDFHSMTEDEQIAYALQMSMQDTQGVETKEEDMEVDNIATTNALETVMKDESFVQAVLEGLPEGESISDETMEAAKTVVDERKEKEEEANKVTPSSTSKKPTLQKKPESKKHKRRYS